jgi:serine/threonine protein kinase
VVRGLQPGDPPLIGPYRLVGRLGSGGMGEVFLGLSAGGRPVAVKVIRTELAAEPEFRVRFGREVAAARQVSGLFTVMVVDADVDGPVPWLATAYVPGPSLAEAVSAHGPLPMRSVLALAAGLAESLSAIHAAGVVHRDLKPSNVLLAEDGPRVIDFGISRAVESTSLTQAGLVVGSPGFMSPEQAVDYEVGPPSDIFSLGAVIAFAATGQGPFGTGTTAALLYRVVHSSPSLDQVPAEVRPLVERCLAKDPGQRPTASRLLTEVGAIAPAADWLPGPPGPDGRRPQRRRRRPLVLAWAIGGLLAVAAAVGFVLAAASGQSAKVPVQSRQAALTSPPTASASARPTAPSASASPSVSPSAIASSSPSASGAVPASVSASPATSASASQSPTTHASASPSPSRSPSPSTSASASPSSSASASASVSASASASASASTGVSAAASPSVSASP